MMLYLGIVVATFAVFAVVAVIVILRSVKKPKMSREMHFVDGADIEKGYVSSDNNFFKGVSDESEGTRVVGTYQRTGKSRSIPIKFLNLRTGRTDTVDMYDQLVIGRVPGNDGYAIESDPSVSKQHCMIFMNDGKLYLMDLQSANHTYLNSNRLTDSVPLSPNDIIKMGNTQLRVKY